MGAAHHDVDRRLRRAVERVRAGDDGAFEEIYRTLTPELLRFFRRRGLAVEPARDLTQETLFHAWKKLDQYDGSGPVAAWVQRIGQNRSYNAWRSEQTLMRAADLEPLPEGAGDAAELRPLFGQTPPGPEAEALQAGHLREVLAALDMLPPGQRRSISLRYGHGLTYREVGDVLKVTVGTVQSQVHAGLTRLRHLLGADGGAGGG